MNEVNELNQPHGSVVLHNAKWQESCDQCQNQEGRHYCLLHSITVKNMDTLRCDDHKPLSSPNQYKL